MTDANGEVLPHSYLAQNPLSALLESAFHDAWGNQSSVQRSDFEGLELREVVCRSDMRVVDLRDRQLPSYGMTRGQIAASPSEHYGCTRDWAQPRSRLSIEGHWTGGFIWNSRQAEITVANAGVPMRVLLTLAEQTTRVAVVYDHDRMGNALFSSSVVHPDLSKGAGLNFVRETATTFGLFVED